MQEKFTVSIPKGEKIVQEVKQLIGRQSLSSVAIDALKLYKNKAVMGTNSYIDRIPDWKIWKQTALDLSDSELDDSIARLEHLIKITKAIKKFNSGVLRSGVDF